MKAPFWNQQTIPASGSAYTHAIPLIRARTVSITVRLYCGAALNANPKVAAQYSPNGSTWDTLDYGYLEMTYTAGTTIQRTGTWDMPEHGFVRWKITNQSAADTLTNAEAWYSIQSWPPEPAQARGDITKSIGQE